MVRRILLRGGFACGILVILAAVKFQTTEVLIATEVARSANRSYETLTSPDSRNVLGLRREGAQVIIDRWSPPAGKVASFSVSLEIPIAVLRIAPDLSYIGWSAGSTLWVRDLAGGTSTRVPAESGAEPLDLGFLPGGTLAALYADGTVERRKTENLELLGRQTLPLKHRDLIAVDGEYIAAASIEEGRLVVYRQLEGAGLWLVEEAKCPPPPFRMLIAGHGQVSLITPGGVVLNGATLNAPGKVRALAFGFQSALVAAGDFEGVYRLAKDQAPLRLAAAAPGGVVAANDEYLIHSSTAGTTSFQFALESRLTSTGKSMIWAGAIFLLLTLLLLLDRFLLELIRKILTLKGKDGLNVRLRFPSPPPELVESAASGKLVLWAGSGLSAQSGMPLRCRFVPEVIETAKLEGWLRAEDWRRLVSRCARGQHEAAMDGLVKAGPGSRGDVFSYVRISYGRTAAVSRSHEVISRLPFAAAVTTNYDGLLDRLGAKWAHNVLHLRMNGQNQKVQTGYFFLLKLYGDLLEPPSVLLSRAEMAVALGEAGGMADVLRRVLGEATVLFTGCSLDGLLADLAKVQPPAVLPRRHFALAAVSDRSWRKKAAELKRKWGVEVLACLEDEIGQALPEFLEALEKSLVGRKKATEAAGVESEAQRR